ncbi:ester cyclase [Streptomyces sp. NPDC052023]|uniref:ester cyclase n=1 Tax=Streptomyces sp. NPDC052023 TaxID=3365681 RepID=UPI0037D1F2AB
MTFVQVIDCKTSRFQELDRLMDAWVEQTKGKRTATHSLIGKDRTDASHFIEIVEFPSYEEAMRNSTLPETDRIFREMVALCDEAPRFTDLDVVRDEQLSSTTVRRFFALASEAGELPPLDEVMVEHHQHHDPANVEDVVGMDHVRRELRVWRDGFDFEFTVEDLIAEGDRVCARWFWKGTHKGEFLGIPATGKDVTMTGTTVFRCGVDGRLAEAWWEYDRLGLMEQLGAFEEMER